MNHKIRMTAAKIARRLELIAPLVYRHKAPLAPLHFKALPGPSEPPPLSEDLDLTGWTPIPPQSYWGGLALDFVLRGEFAVPANFDTRAPIALALRLGDAGGFNHPEALAYVDGTPYASVDRQHHEILLAPEHCDERTHRLTLHGWTGVLGITPPAPGRQLFMGENALVQIHQLTRDFVAAARLALQTADLLDDDEPAKARLYNALDAAFRQLDTREPFGAPFYESIPPAFETLRAGITSAGPPLETDLIAAGHAHIDVAWLWTLDQTRRKARRTFYNVLRLMEQFPGYRFTQGQPQLYEFVRQDDPALFEAIEERVAEGRWEPLGGMWVEADCNLTGAESLARQFLLGRAFFREHFGDAESPVLWLPDVFGYAWSLPQLIKEAGLEYFFTIKLGWNQINTFPYDSFWWQGIDGTRVLTHLSTTPSSWEETGDVGDLRNPATYNANLDAFAALGSWLNLQHKATQRVMLMSYGYGDGGGGPTREMLENAQELASFPALPRVRQGRVIDFFRRLDAESGDSLPTWNAELYLEIHRGTYTSQARNKRANRKSEFLLHDAEFLATQASLLDPNYAYPHAHLRRAWELVCLNQFHDIIPGSSIHEVYTESLAQYAEVAELGKAARDAAIEAIASHTGGDLLLANPTGFPRSDLAFWPGSLPEGQRIAGAIVTQPVAGGTLIGGAQLAPYSILPLTFESGAPGEPDAARFPLAVTPERLENAFVRVELDPAGDVTRIYDKVAEREILPPGAVANQFQAFEDRPLEWDAWDVDIFYEEKRFLAEPATSRRVVERGPLRATVEIRRRILNSDYTQRISLAYDSPRIDVETVIDWRERHVLLKVAFPVQILSPVATHEIQWGSVERPTHRNTSWDWARFETYAHKWVDLSEGGYGVALLNDCKYGHDVHDNVIRISLLRAPTVPDPEADQGEHRFAYSLYPHTNAGTRVLPSEVARPAYALNDPLIVAAGGGGAGAPPPPAGRDTAQRHRRDHQAGGGRRGRGRAPLRVRSPARLDDPADRLPDPRSLPLQPVGGEPGGGRDNRPPADSPPPQALPDRHTAPRPYPSLALLKEGRINRRERRERKEKLIF